MSTTPANGPGWAVRLRGEKIDLDDWKDAFPVGGSTWVEDRVEGEETLVILRSTDWVMMAEAAEVLRDAERLIAIMNGIMMLTQDDSQPIGAGEIMKFHPDGSRDAVIIAAVGTAYGIGRCRARFVAGPNSTPTAAAPNPARIWLSDADSDDDRAQLFTLISQATNWFQLYMAAEMVRRVAGNQGTLKVKLGVFEKTFGTTWQTINCHRHAPDPVKFPLPANPPDFHTARGHVLRAAKLVLS